ncbi:hypothetical protein [Streptomyces sp. HUAS TT20]|uniref:hypothetical protein n=1 Tax=Streptomyces sp. HUAS TT20 TaxID=3447509 RepID=UPI0021DA93BA|nr:hypothetical protein [Streptomyces sp. HUAS 15-9]UXY32933.1 hypothetical protein N8I87_40765 [Streptomyces sp. HUAS 15-9]
MAPVAAIGAVVTERAWDLPAVAVTVWHDTTQAVGPEHPLCIWVTVRVRPGSARFLLSVV